ncbi:TonB-dependent receptor domain-containing protein [Pontixanthobacter aquaemixtae]|uniref:TonB-dependent receptor n=1 Tax=Pontixanthobacter aquaemixtae TaxID=1958940 RepID=A0A844ZWJ8_9SPHN|nr:TonB-dependent receptor [Pontixanthobacter aquaemixtae]MXO89879.1 TonB-dependent receptor [Pontixanthobacter aquaemixtae]
MTFRTRYLLSSMLAFPALAIGACPAMAQDAEDGVADDGNTIIVTGTYIRGQTEDGSLPVEVYSTEELSQRGIDSPLELVRSLPSVGTTLGESNQYAAGGSQGVGSINLRNLGRERTLVLMNGRRFFNEPGDGASDTNLIPLFALERVEVLKDGASTTYGSDAIAGVANFVTRKNFSGIEVGGNYQFVDGSDGNWQASILAGQDFGDANIMVGFGYQKRSELDTLERSFTQRPYEVNPSGWSFLSDAGTYIPKLGPITLGPAGTSLGLGVDGQLDGACEAVGGLAGVFPSGASSFPVCRYTYIPFVNLIEEENRYQAFAQLDVDLSDSLRFVADALYSHTDVPQLGYSPSYPPTSGPRGPGTAQAFFVPRSNPGFDTFLTQTFPTGSPAFFASYASILFSRPFALTGNPLDDQGSGEGAAFNDAWRVTAGFEKEFGGNFKGELYTTYLRSAREAYSFDIIGDRLQRALNGLGGPNCTGTTPGANGCLYFNPFLNSRPGNPALGLDNPSYVPGNENNPDVIEWFRARNGTAAREELFVTDLVFSGEFELGIPVSYAFGGQYRKSTFVTRPLNDFSDPDAYPCALEGDTSCLDDPNDNNFPTGAFIFLGQYPAANLSQDVYALFAEVQAEPIEGLELNAAIRFEDYGGSVGSTINPKFTARWQLTDWLALRGSIGDTFRGPLPGDLTPVGASAVAGIDVLGNNFKATDSGGNPNLKPETALTYNVGAIIQSSGFTLTADFWNYEFEGRFTDLPIQAIAAQVAPGGTDGQQSVNCASPFTQFVVFQGGVCDANTIGLDISRIRTQTVNGPDTTLRGIDIGISYGTDLGTVTLDVGANATHILEYQFSDFVYEGLTFSQGYDAVGFANYNRAPGTVSPWRGNAYASLGFGAVTATYNFQYIDGVTDNRCTPGVACASTPEFGDTDFGREVGSYSQHDLLVSADIDTAGVDFTITAGIENIFDTDPPAARLEYGYDPFIGSALGRTFKLGTKVRF